MPGLEQVSLYLRNDEVRDMILPRPECIPTPWPQRLRGFRRSVLPGASFLVCVVVMFWLWERQGQMPNAVGEWRRSGSMWRPPRTGR